MTKEQRDIHKRLTALITKPSVKGNIANLPSMFSWISHKRFNFVSGNLNSLPPRMRMK